MLPNYSKSWWCPKTASGSLRKRSNLQMVRRQRPSSLKSSRWKDWRSCSWRLTPRRLRDPKNTELKNSSCNDREFLWRSTPATQNLSRLRGSWWSQSTTSIFLPSFLAKLRDSTTRPPTRPLRKSLLVTSSRSHWLKPLWSRHARSPTRFCRFKPIWRISSGCSEDSLLSSSHAWNR